MLEFSDVALRLGGRSILDGVSLEVPPAAVTAVIGPNGAGKSTLFRIAAGEVEPTSGSVLVGGRPIPGWDRVELARRRAVLPQASTLSFGFSVLEVVLLGRTPHAASRAEDLRVAEAALAEVGLTGFESRSFLTLSGGERQRVHLARVLAQIWPGNEDHLMLLDEPTSALDLVHQHGTLSLACRLAKRGVALAVVLHDLNLAARYASRIALMSEGRVVAEGSPDEVLRPSVLEPVFKLPVDVLELTSPRQRVVLARASQ